jgi:glutamate synthase (NADPH/NADH) large chain
MLLSVGAINTHLIKNKLRGYASINVQTGRGILIRIHLQHLIGVGATTVNPYLALDSLIPKI